MTQEQGKKKFPAYFSRFQLPEAAAEQELRVFRACATGKVDRASFQPTFEENGFQLTAGAEQDDPQEYSLSTYIKWKDVRRFMAMTSRYRVPFVIAVGKTAPRHGICAETRKWKKKYRGSHVDWWLYENAEPWQEFKEVMDDDME